MTKTGKKVSAYDSGLAARLLAVLATLVVLMVIGANAQTVLPSTGDINTVAGGGSNCGNGSFSGDNGSATKACLNGPSAVAVDSAGNIYIADTSNDRIRKVTALTGNITTVAGGGPGCTTGSPIGDGGLATSACLNAPSGVALDAAGDIYIADTSNGRVRVVNPSTTGSVTITGVMVGPLDIATVAGGGKNSLAGPNGTGNNGPGNNGPATGAALSAPHGVALDSCGNIYISDTQTLLVSAVNAGRSGCPTKILGIAISPDDIAVVAGAGVGSSACNSGSDNDCAATSAEFDKPFALAVDAAGNLYVADNFSVTFKVASSNNVITIVAGKLDSPGSTGDLMPATSAELHGPMGVAVDSANNIYIGDTGNNKVRVVNTSTTTTTQVGTIDIPPTDIDTVVGGGSGTCTGGATDSVGDGCPTTDATLTSPEGLALGSSGILYIADTGNNRIRAAGLPDVTMVTLTGTVQVVGAFTGQPDFNHVEADVPNQTPQCFGGGTSSILVPKGSSVVLHPIPACDSLLNCKTHFVSWSGACSGTSSCSLTMNANASFGALFSDRGLFGPSRCGSQ